MTRNIVPVALADGSTTSALAAGRGLTPAGVYIPKNFSGTAITFNAYTPSGQDVGLVGDGAGASYTRTVRAGDFVPLPRDVFAGIDERQIISGTSPSAHS